MVKNGSKSGSKSDPKMTLFRPPTGIDFSLMMVKIDPLRGSQTPWRVIFGPPQMTCFKKVRKRHMKLTQSGQKAKKRAKKSVIFGSFLIPLKSSFYIVDSHKCQKSVKKKRGQKSDQKPIFDPFLTPFLYPTFQKSPRK